MEKLCLKCPIEKEGKERGYLRQTLVKVFAGIEYIYETRAELCLNNTNTLTVMASPVSGILEEISFNSNKNA
jgi:hypothetical protein